MDIRLPPLAEGVESATVVNILVKEGDAVTEGQTVLELETAKAVGSVPSPAAGKIGKILVKEGQEVKIGQVVATLANGAGASSAPAPQAPQAAAAPTGPAPTAPQQRSETRVQEERRQEPAGQGSTLQEAGIARPTQAPSNRPLPAGIPVAAAPSLRKAAAELGFDLSKVQGSGNGGRIELEDVRNYLAYLQSLVNQPQQAGAAPAPAATPAIKTTPLPDFSKWGSVKRETVSTLRRTIAERMVESWTMIPHVTQFYEADITRLMELRKKYVPMYEKKKAKLTLTSFVVYALARLLKKNPLFNTSYDPAKREIIYKDYVSIGIAVDSEAGLMVPVIRDADKKSLLELSLAIQELAEKVRSRKVGMEDMQGGTFTISNEGAIGGAYFTPIINMPETAILGLGQGQVKAIVVGNKVQNRLMLPLSLSHDHRVIDGAPAARFVRELTLAFEQFAEQDIKLGK
jgi:pyruvate dehydrogenase E2 component (dihydrolipoamide acetyltransferase)